MEQILQEFKSYAIDESSGKNIKLYDYSDLTITTAATAAHIVRNLYQQGQIDLLEYGGFLALDEDNYCYGYSIYSKGGIVQTTADPQIIYKNIYLCNAKKIILFHNHPSGNLIPSKADINVTYVMSSILVGLGIPCIDHVIVSPLGFYSFAEDKKYEYFQLTRYAATGMKIVEGSIDAYMPELKLYVKETNVTEAFYKKNKVINSSKVMNDYFIKLMDKNKTTDKRQIGFIAINASGYPDFIMLEEVFDLKSEEYFKKFSKTMMSACTTFMGIFINTELEGGTYLDSEDLEFFIRLGTLGMMVGLNVNDIVLRDLKTSKIQSIMQEVVEGINRKTRRMSSASSQDEQQRLMKIIDFK